MSVQSEKTEEQLREIFCSANCSNINSNF